MIIKRSKTADTKKTWKRVVSVLEIMLLIVLTVGCQGNSKSKDIVFTTGLNGSELFKIGSNKCKISEAKILLLTMQKQYEKLFGKDNWNQEFGGGTVGDYVKQQVVTQLSQIKSMKLMAEKSQIALNSEEKEKALAAAQEFNAALSDEQRKELGINKDEVAELYQQYALSKKLYQELIKDVNAEVSDDEARIIRVQQILFKTYQEDENGNKVEMQEDEKKAVNQKAYQVWERINAGEDFESLAAEFTDDSTVQYTFGRGEMPDNFEEAAFNLKNSEVSQIVETEYGLHIIKCVSNYEKSDTDANKKVIYEQRCSEMFNEKYDTFMEKLSLEFNNKAWGKVKLANNDDIADIDFFEIYNKHFG